MPNLSTITPKGEQRIACVLRKLAKKHQRESRQVAGRDATQAETETLAQDTWKGDGPGPFFDYRKPV